MYARYVDDCNGAAQAIPPQLTYNPTTKSLVPHQPNPNLTPEEHTFCVFKSVADDISDMMKWTVDIPDKHDDKCLPILELKAFLYKNIEDDRTYVRHKFYKKEVSRKMTITERSALSTGVKRSILVSEGLRRLLNTSPALIEEYKPQLMDDFNKMMMRSGHYYKLCVKIVQIVLEKYSTKVKECQESNKSMYRSKKEMKMDKVQKLDKGKQWFRSKGYTAVLNFPVTPHGLLKKRISRSLERQGL